MNTQVFDVTRFPMAKNGQQLASMFAVYRQTIKSNDDVHQWVRLFKSLRTISLKTILEFRPSVVSDELV